MHSPLREAASRVTARVVGSRFAKPVARVVLAACALVLLAAIGRSSLARARPPEDAPTPAAPAALAVPIPSSMPPPDPAPAPLLAAAPAPDPTSRTGGSQATPDDPVFLNTAGIDDLRRLPGVGEKRATAIVALRTRLGGRFRAVEDLLKVKGIGRATLRRLRPLVRLDPPPQPDGGAGEAPR